MMRRAHYVDACWPQSFISLWPIGEQSRCQAMLMALADFINTSIWFHSGSVRKQSCSPLSTSQQCLCLNPISPIVLHIPMGTTCHTLHHSPLWVKTCMEALMRIPHSVFFNPCPPHTITNMKETPLIMGWILAAPDAMPMAHYNHTAMQHLEQTNVWVSLLITLLWRNWQPLRWPWILLSRWHSSTHTYSH